MSLLNRVGFRELRRDRRIAKSLHEDPVLILFEGLKYYKNIEYHQLVLKSALLYQAYLLFGKLRAIKGLVTLYVSAGYKLRFSL